MVDVISRLEQFARDNSIHFIYGSDEYASADRHGYAPGENVLVADYEANIFFNTNNNIFDPEREEYRIIMMFGRKADNDGRKASLDETMNQKHKRRLSELTEFAYNNIKKFACNNDLLMSSIRVSISPNMFSDNLDFVNCVVNFEY